MQKIFIDYLWLSEGELFYESVSKIGVVVLKPGGCNPWDSGTR